MIITALSFLRLIHSLFLYEEVMSFRSYAIENLPLNSGQRILLEFRIA